MSDRQMIADFPQQGMMYHMLTARVAANHTGLGPTNIASSPYNHMIGLNFQKPLSGGSANIPVVPGNHIYR